MIWPDRRALDVFLGTLPFCALLLWRLVQINRRKRRTEKQRQMLKEMLQSVATQDASVVRKQIEHDQK